MHRRLVRASASKRILNVHNPYAVASYKFIELIVGPNPFS